MKDKLVVIHQPDFMPYMGFFDRLLKADIYVVLDNVQYVRGSSDHWTNRDQIKTKNGATWITVNVKKAHRETNICDIYLAEEHGWRDRCRNMFRENYSKAPYYGEINPYIEEMLNFDCERLMDFNLNVIRKVNELLDIDVEIVLASDLKPEGHSNELLVNIMKKLGQTRYLSGTGARDYYEEEIYVENGIEIVWQEFEHPVYPQQHGEFIPYLSIIDLLYNCGIERSREILRGGSSDGK